MSSLSSGSECKQNPQSCPSVSRRLHAADVAGIGGGGAGTVEVVVVVVVVVVVPPSGPGGAGPGGTGPGGAGPGAGAAVVGELVPHPCRENTIAAAASGCIAFVICTMICFRLELFRRKHC